MRNRTSSVALLGGAISALLWASCECSSLPVGESCETDVDCASDLVCADGYCRRPCNSGVDCEVSESCRGGVCVPEVASDSGTRDRAADGALADTARADLGALDHAILDAAALDAIAVDTAVADSAVADSAAPDTLVPDASAPDSSPGDLSQPDTLCVPNCGERQCGGPEGCGDICGTCVAPLECSPSGYCECNNNQCGDSCCELGELCVGDHCCPQASWRSTFEGKYLFDAVIDSEGHIYVVGNDGGSAYVARLDACGRLVDERSFKPSWASTASAGNITKDQNLLFVTGPGITISSDFTLATDPADAMLAVLNASTLNDAVPPFRLQDLDEERVLDVEVDGAGMVWMAGATGVTPGAVVNRLSWLVLSDGQSWTDERNPWGTIDDRAYARNVIFHPSSEHMYLIGDWHESGGTHRGRVSYYQTSTTVLPDPDIPDPTLLAEILPDDAVSFAAVDSLLRGGQIFVAGLEYAPAYPDGRATVARVNISGGAVLHAPEKFNPTAFLDSPFSIATVPYTDMIFLGGVVDWDEGLTDQFANASAFLVRYDADDLSRVFALTYSRFLTFHAVKVDPGHGLIVVALGGGTTAVSSTVMRCDTDGVCP